MCKSNIDFYYFFVSMKFNWQFIYLFLLLTRFKFFEIIEIKVKSLNFFLYNEIQQTEIIAQIVTQIIIVELFPILIICYCKICWIFQVIHWIESFSPFARIVLCSREKNMLQKYISMKYLAGVYPSSCKTLQKFYNGLLEQREPCQYQNSLSLIDSLKIPFETREAIRNIRMILINWHISVNKLFQDWFKSKKARRIRFNQ